MANITAGQLSADFSRPRELATSIARPIALRRIALWGAVVVGLASMAMSVAAQVEVAEWMMLQAPVTWLLPVAIDGSIVVLSIVATHQRALGRPVRSYWTGVGCYTIVSIVINALHVVTESPQMSDGGDQVRMFTGAALAGIMPITIWAVTHAVINMLVEPPSPAVDEQPFVGVDADPGFEERFEAAVSASGHPEQGEWHHE